MRRLLTVLLFISSPVFAGIELVLENTKKDTHLLLPVPYDEINLNHQLTLSSQGVKLNAKFFVLNTWPNTEDDTFIRLLLIEAPTLSGFSGKLNLEWQYSKNQTHVITPDVMRQLDAKTQLVYPSANWLKASVLLHPPREKVENNWYLEPQKRYAEYVTDQVALKRAGYGPNRASQWLYDRAQAIYQLFVMSGEEKWLHRANDLSSFYLKHIDNNGVFDLTKYEDIKYSMPRGLAYRYLLTGDTQALNALERQFEFSLEWDEAYSISRGFWTERNQASALNTALMYWELTGSQQAKNRIDAIIAATVEMTFNPKNDWPLRGCPQHSFKSHEGSGDNTPVCSPWMMALLGDALWRYYQLTNDQSSASLLDAFGDFVLNHGIYFVNQKVNEKVIPKYLVSMDNKSQEELNQWTDPQHVCDVAGLLAKSAYIKARRLKDNFMVTQLFAELLNQCKSTYNKIKKKDSPVVAWKIMPPRRFGWMYSSTSDLPWLADVLLD